MATGVGVGPFLSLTRLLLARGFERPIRLLCDALSQPPADWRGLPGRMTVTLPADADRPAGKHFYVACLLPAFRGRVMSDTHRV